jgi:PAS domain S-box-containing protein
MKSIILLLSLLILPPLGTPFTALKNYINGTHEVSGAAATGTVAATGAGLSGVRKTQPLKSYAGSFFGNKRNLIFFILAAGAAVLLVLLVILELRIKKINRDLRQSEAWFRNLFNKSSDAIFLHTMSEDGGLGPFIEVNEAACRMLEYEKAELLRLSPGEIDEPGFTEKREEYSRVLIDRRSVLFETVHVTKTGKRVPVEINAHLIELYGRT